ncbi:MAG: hypothetical protein HOQ34_04440 [Gemmatimonadaceae bacterium]|nr:hypothetical protein [Gemmatimonadaceae bacterium]
MGVTPHDATLFDAAAVREALQRPEYKDTRGKLHVGGLLSVEEFWHHMAWWRTANGPLPGQVEAWNAGFRALLDAVFPPSWWAKLLRRSVADDALTLPGKSQYEVAERFFGCLASAHMNVDALLAAQSQMSTTGETTTTETIDPSSTGRSGT